MHALLGGIFSAAQLALIECEFEGHDVEGSLGQEPIMEMFGRDEDGDVTDAEPLFKDETRMLKIMENIVANAGTFVPVAP